MVPSESSGVNFYCRVLTCVTSGKVIICQQDFLLPPRKVILLLQHKIAGLAKCRFTTNNCYSYELKKPFLYVLETLTNNKCKLHVDRKRGPNNCMFWAMTEAEGEVGIPWSRFKPPSILILTVPMRYFCCGSLLLLVLAVCIYTLVQLLY